VRSKEDIVTYHIRIRPSALVIREDAILLVEYRTDERGLHYYLPGGGAEPGETLKQTIQREMLEETTASIEVGDIAFLYECEPQDRPDDYSPPSHTVFIIFDCTLCADSSPQMPANPELNQTDVKWIPLKSLNEIKLVPNIAPFLLEYASNNRNIQLIEDHINAARNPSVK